MVRERTVNKMIKANTVGAERRAQIGTEKRVRTRASILDAAFQVIGKESGRLARIEEVTAVARVARPTFYTYFNGLDELFAALSYEISHEYNLGVEAYCAIQNDAAKEASGGIRYYLRKAAEDHKWGWGMVNLSFFGPIFGVETHRMVTETVVKGLKSGVFKAHSVNVGRDMMLGTTLAAMTTLLHGEGGRKYPEIVAREILVGLGMTPSRADQVIGLTLPDPESLLKTKQGTAAIRKAVSTGRRQPGKSA